MFTGIVEALGLVERVEREGSNIHFTLRSPISDALHIDQSVCHDGACLTIVGVGEGCHVVTAVEETLRRTTLGEWQPGRKVNLERSLSWGGRLDGHLVQGHVDDVAICTDIEPREGSWRLTFRYRPNGERILVDKGSICLNGVSLTVVEPKEDLFSVAIIPYTWAHTNLSQLRIGDRVNVEFDILGKYVARYLMLYGQIQTSH
ncbi:MAG: riboflavin synthase [Saprospiraceae bacterium]|nr:riboflavin synthase [Saprospiraceae bacterium]MDW8482804.1 riboflavin synthase [Saprospiraceae bacterium]